MKNKRKSVTISQPVYKALRGACLLADVRTSDALEYAATRATEWVRIGWKPPHIKRDTTTIMQEMP